MPRPTSRDRAGVVGKAVAEAAWQINQTELYVGSGGSGSHQRYKFD